MKKFAVLFIIASAFALQAQPIRVTQTDQNIINYLFKGEWQKADSLSNLEILKNPEHPKYYFMKAYISFYSRFTTSDSPNRAECINLIKYYAWKAITLGEKYPETPEINFYLGNSYAFLSRVNVMEHEYWTAYWNGSKSENYLEDVLEESPQSIDSYFNLGVLEYFPATSITDFQSVLAWFGGMSGDKELGLDYFKKVAENGNLFKDEAKYALGLIYSYRERDLNTALNYWGDLRNKYPESNRINRFYETTYLSNLIREKGVKFLEDEFDSLKTKYNLTRPTALNSYGYQLLVQERFEEALKVYNINIRLFPIVANGYDSLAECYMTMGDNQNAVKFYKIAYNKLPADTTASEETKIRLRESITDKLDELGASIEG